MKENDLIHVDLQPEELTTCKDSIKAINDVISKIAPSLTNEERKNYGSINDSNKLFVNKTKLLMEKHPNLVPTFVNMVEFNSDYNARVEIEKLLIDIDDLKRKLEDTKILLDNDNYQDALAFYRSIRYYAQEKQDLRFKYTTH